MKKRGNSSFLPNLSTRTSNETYDDTVRWRLFVKAGHCRRHLKGTVENAREKEAGRCSRHDVFGPDIARKMRLRNNARWETAEKRPRRRKTPWKEAKKKEKLKETLLGKDIRIPRPIYHKPRGLWRESMRILPGGARKMRIAVPRAVLDKNIRCERKKGNIEGRKRRCVW